jgi:ribosomal protein L11 methyltransferase
VSEPRYPFVAIDVPVELAEAAASQLFDLGALGVEQRDATTLARGAKSEGPIVDPGADVGAPVWSDHGSTGNPGEIVTLLGSFADHETARVAMEAFDAELSPRIEEVVGDAWRDAWKEHFEPFRLTTHLVVRPPWKEAPRALVDEVEGTHVLELEPGRAFGTGLHASTALVAQVLDDRRASLAGGAGGARDGGVELLDVGCGSGILSLVALSLGAKNARAVDVDADAVRVTIENAERAGFAHRLVGDTTDVGAIDRSFPLVLANIQAEVLVPRAADITARVAAGGVLVLSGVLVTQRDRVRAAYPLLDLVDAPTRGEWIALVLTRPL